MRLKFIASKTSGGAVKGKISLYCRVLDVSREGFRKYLINCDKPWKYEPIAEEMRQILAEDECNDTYGRLRMYQSLKLRNSKLHIPSERTVYRIMREIGINHTPRRNQTASPRRIETHVIPKTRLNVILLKTIVEDDFGQPEFSFCIMPPYPSQERILSAPETDLRFALWQHCG